MAIRYNILYNLHTAAKLFTTQVALTDALVAVLMGAAGILGVIDVYGAQALDTHHTIELVKHTVKIVDDVDDVLLSSQEGIIIRLHANEIPVQSRYGSGVRVMRLGENDKVMVLARTDHDDEAQTETVEAEEGDEPTAEQLAAMEAADEASASEAPAED